MARNSSSDSASPGSQRSDPLLRRWLGKLVPLVRSVGQGQRANDNAERAKGLFLANMSHELRTPLHAILSYAQLGRDASADEQREYFARITQRGQGLLHMLNDLLDLSQLEAGSMHVEIGENDVEALARDALILAANSFETKQVRVQIERAQNCPDCRAEVDAVLLGKLFDNLLSNAARYSPQGGNVGIRFARTELSDGARQQPALELTIADEGIGIPEPELELVFDKFVQSSKTRSNAGGTGLGLAICREIVALHGGKIWASNNRGASATLAKGATLHVLLPLSQGTASSGRGTI